MRLFYTFYAESFGYTSIDSNFVSPEFLKAILDAHGGLSTWQKVESITIKFNLSGALLKIKGYPYHYVVTAIVDAHKQETMLWGIGNAQNQLIYTPSETTVVQIRGEGNDPEEQSVITTRREPRLSFDNSTRTTLWDEHHVAYFFGYAFWYYMTLPFCFTLPGFKTREVESYEEQSEHWRVLEVTFPEYITTHNKVQRFYFDDRYNLRRMNYVAEVVGDDTVKHYVYDYKVTQGLAFPMLRRVWSFSPAVTSFLIDIFELKIKFSDGEHEENARTGSGFGYGLV